MKPPTSNKTISLSFGPSNEGPDESSHAQHPDDAAVADVRAWIDGAHDENLIELEARTLRGVLAVLDGWHQNAENMREQRNTAQDRAKEDIALARAETAELRIRLQAAEAALENREQQLRENIATALYQRASDLVIEAGRDTDDTMVAIISAEAQGFSNAALFIRDRTEQVPDDE